MSEELTRRIALQLGFAQDGGFVKAIIAPPDVDLRDGIVIATIGAGAFFDDEPIREAFIALAKQIVSHGVAGAPDVVSHRFLEDPTNAN